MIKERIESLKYMRVVAMMLVVLIHTTAVAITSLDVTSKFYPLYLLLNRFTRFEGSVFVFLSGVVLFYNYQSRAFTSTTWLVFYNKRFMYILVPYILWSLFYELYSYAFEYRSYEGIGVIVKNLINGTSFYQLYFILILVQLYFLLPIFIYLVKKFPLFKKYLFVFGFLIEFVYQVLNRKYGFVGFPLFSVYLASFFLGGWVGIYYPQLKKILAKYIYWILFTLATSLGIVYTFIFYNHNILKNIILDYPYYKLLAMSFYLLACYVLFKGSLWLEENLSLNSRRWVENLRIYSFGFYLVHPFILDLWEKAIVAQTPWQFHVFIFLRYALVVLSCYGFIRLIHKLFPQAWMIFGKLPKPQ